LIFFFKKKNFFLAIFQTKTYSLVEKLSEYCNEIELPSSIGNDIARQAMRDQRLHTFENIDQKSLKHLLINDDDDNNNNDNNDIELMTGSFTNQLN
jgi:hypothetical protein